MSFSDNLQTLRKANNISQEQLAERLNVTRQTVSKWETGGYPEIDKIIALCQMFGCTMDELITGTVNVGGDASEPAVESEPAPEVETAPEPEELSYTYTAPEQTQNTAPEPPPTYVPPKQKSGKTATVVAVTIVVIIAMFLIFAGFAIKVVFNDFLGWGGLNFSGHDINLFGWGTRYTYANSSQYLAASEFTVGDGIDRIDIDWISGDVTIVPSEGDEIYIYEIADTTKSGYGMMRYRIYNGTIYIKFREPGRYWKLAQKSLVIEVPEYLSEGISLDVSTVSAMVACEHGMTFSDTDIETVSGMVSLSDFSTPKLKVDTVSGGVTVNGAVYEADIETVSGNVGVFAERACSDISVDTVSGDIGVEVYSAFSDIDLGTVSGKVSLRLREGTPRDIYIDTVSGSIDVNGTRVKRGYSANNADGSGEIDIDTTSGDVKVEILSKY